MSTYCLAQGRKQSDRPERTQKMKEASMSYDEAMEWLQEEGGRVKVDSRVAGVHEANVFLHSSTGVMISFFGEGYTLLEDVSNYGKTWTLLKE